MSIIIRSLQKSFGNRMVFDDFSYEFKDRGIYIIEGESGVGKTTLLRIIAGLDNDYSGEVLGCGTGKCAMMFQEYRLFPTISALDNVMLANRHGVIEDARHLLHRLGLTDEDILLLPDELSGGMKQRVSFARSVFSKMPIILLDEPTKELDSGTAMLMLNMINELGNNHCIIMVSHQDCSDILTQAEHIMINLP